MLCLASTSSLRKWLGVDAYLSLTVPYVNNESNQKEFKELGQRLSERIDSGKNEEAITLFLTDPNGVGLPEEVVAGMRQLPNWESMAALAPTLVFDTAIASRFAPLEQVSHLTTPTLLIVGENSPVSMHEIASQLSEAMPNGRFNKLAGQDHMVDPVSLLPVLSSFLKS